MLRSWQLGGRNPKLEISDFRHHRVHAAGGGKREDMDVSSSLAWTTTRRPVSVHREQTADTAVFIPTNVRINNDMMM